MISDPSKHIGALKFLRAARIGGKAHRKKLPIDHNTLTTLCFIPFYIMKDETKVDAFTRSLRVQIMHESLLVLLNMVDENLPRMQPILFD